MGDASDKAASRASARDRIATAITVGQIAGELRRPSVPAAITPPPSTDRAPEQQISRQVDIPQPVKSQEPSLDELVEQLAHQRERLWKEEQQRSMELQRDLAAPDEVLDRRRDDAGR